nr:zinc finger, CCHC-type [Tanacetum cinerariifolium]
MASPKLEKTLSTQSNWNTNKSHDCVIFLGYGICSYYPRCKFNHPSTPPKNPEIGDEKAQKTGRWNTPCKYYLAGTCKYRSFCKYDHSRPIDPPQQYNSTGLPSRPGVSLITLNCMTLNLQESLMMEQDLSFITLNYMTLDLQESLMMEQDLSFITLNYMTLDLQESLMMEQGLNLITLNCTMLDLQESLMMEQGLRFKFDYLELHDARSSGVTDDGAGFKFDYLELHDARSTGVTHDGAGFKFDYSELHDTRSSGVTDDGARFKFDHLEPHDTRSSGVTDDGAWFKFDHPEPHHARSSGVTDDGPYGSEKYIHSGNQGKGASGNYEKKVICKFGRVNFDEPSVPLENLTNNVPLMQTMGDQKIIKESVRDFKHTLKHGKDDISLVQLGSHLRIEEPLRAQDTNKGKGKEVGGLSVNMTEEGGKNKHHKQNKGIAEVVKRTTQMLVVLERGLRTNPKTKVDAIAWWIDSGATTHVCKDRCWFKTYETVEDGSVLYMGDDHFAPVHGKGSVALEFSSEKTITLCNVLYVPKLRKNLVSGPMLNKCGYKHVYESDKYILSKSGVFVGFGYYNNGMFMLNLNKVPDDLDSVYTSSSTVVNSSLWHARLGHMHYKRMLEMSKDDLIHAIDENPEKCTTSPYTPQQNSMAERKNRALKEMVNSMLSYSGLSEGFWGEAMLTACYLLNRVPNKKNKTTPYELCPKDIIPNVQESQMDDHTYDVPNEIPEPQKGKRVRKAKLYGSDFQLYLVEGSRDQVGSQYSYCYSIEEDPRTYNEAMQSRDAAFWKEAIDNEIGSIMENNTWVLSDLPHGCKPLGCKWIFKRKMKVDGTIDKFKARL